MQNHRFFTSAQRLADSEAEALPRAVLQEALGLLGADAAALVLPGGRDVIATEGAVDDLLEAPVVRALLGGKAGQEAVGAEVSVWPLEGAFGLSVPLTGFKAKGCLVARVASAPDAEAHASCAVWGRLVAQAFEYRALEGELVLQREAETQKLDAALNLYDLYEEAINQAFTDGLTGLANKVFFHQRLDQEFAEASRYGQPLSLLVLDVDHFKHVNDSYGHQMGDEVLKRMGELIRASIRACDLGARFGGEEFAVILPNTEEEGAFILAERIRLKLESLTFETPTVTFRVTTSIGVATLGGRMATPQDFVEDADRGLYQAKRSGRNRVCGNHEDAISVVTAQQVFAAKQGTSFEIASALVMALELKSPALAAHARAVAAYAQRLGQAIGLHAEMCGTLYMAGLLHDIGKLGIPGELLQKPVLTPEETALYQLHPILANNLLNRLSGFKAVRDAVHHHHERIDGGGFPEGMAGEQIPLSSRILAVCNAYDNLVRGTPDRSGMSVDYARSELLSGSGTRFDPAIIQQFLQLELPALEYVPHS